ncbi:MAG: PAS domain S-box protein [Deltaproteobacteria bacterium]|nr:PAS domain S-box protein [Deltaproteobacteria bacterium]
MKVSLKDRILIPLTLGLFFLLVVFLASLFWIERNNIEQRVDRKFKSTEDFFDSQLKDDAHLFSGMLETIMNDQAIQTALKAGDRKALLSHTALLFKRISSQHPVTHLYFSNAQRINLLRVHQPERYGDRIDRFTTLKAEETGKIAYGLELGPMGTLTLRVVAPLIENGKRIGFVELGEELYHITAKLKKTIGVDLVIHLHKKFLDRPGWEAGMKMMDRPYDWDRFPDVVLLEQTLPVKPEVLTKFFSEGSHKVRAINEEIFSQNHRYRYRFSAIKDVQGVEVGDMIVMIDVTSQVSNLYSTMRVTAIFTVFLGGVLFFLFRFFLMRVEDQLTTAQQKIIDLEKDHTRMESEAKFYSVAQSVNDAMISSDSSGKIDFWNPAAVLMFGYQEEEVLGQSLTMIIPERYREAHRKGMEQLKTGGEGRLIGKTSELFGLKKDGTEFPLELSLARWTAGNETFYSGLIRDISERKRAEEAEKKSFEQLRKALVATVRAIATVVESRDPYTAGHQRRVAELARSIASEMRLSKDQIDGLRLASLVHDIGKISVPAEILTKPTKLTEIEFDLIKIHAQSGYDILKNIEFPWPIARIVHEHHERINGSGYPNSLTEDEILLESRILMVADVVEAIASHRPYRPANGIEKALEEISKNKGILYDPDVVDACLILFSEKGYSFN